MPYRGLIPYYYPTKELRRSQIFKITKDVWEIEGYISANFFFKAPSSNIFILRDDDMALLIDTGLYPYYRTHILHILNKLRNNGVKKLNFMVTQGHFDHIANNDIIFETDFDEVHFYLPKIELETINMYNHWIGEFQELEDFYNPYNNLPPLIRYPSKISKKMGRIIMSGFTKRLFKGIETVIDKAEILTNEAKIKKEIGQITFTGWEIGRFFAIHDGAHSPGHVSIYDPKDKLLLTGDATVEINPAFYNTSLNKCINIITKFRKLSEQGYVHYVADSHHSSSNYQLLFEKFNVKPLHPVQLENFAKNNQKCIEFFRMFEKFYKTIKDEVIKAHSRIGPATIPEIVKELKNSKKKEMKFKMALKFPKFPSRLDILVAVVLKEANCSYYCKGKKILFLSKKNWNEDKIHNKVWKI